jgi:16S rRNA (guanine966-N2)-methyltransferase
VGDRIRGARFLDLFAGTGVFAFEAVSRGAASAIAVDRDTKAIDRLAKEWNAPVKTIAADVFAARVDSEIDLVYADPPYDFDRYDDLLLAIDKMKLADGALVAIEHRRGGRAPSPVVDHLAFERRAEYGEVSITFFRAIWNSP